MNEKLELALAAWKEQEELHAKYALSAGRLFDLVKQLCKHEDGYTETESYFSGSYYDQAYTMITRTCKICGHSETKDSGWRGGYG